MEIGKSCCVSESCVKPFDVVSEFRLIVRRQVLDKRRQVSDKGREVRVRREVRVSKVNCSVCGVEVRGKYACKRKYCNRCSKRLNYYKRIPVGFCKRWVIK